MIKYSHRYMVFNSKTIDNQIVCPYCHQSEETFDHDHFLTCNDSYPNLHPVDRNILKDNFFKTRRLRYLIRAFLHRTLFISVLNVRMTLKVLVVTVGKTMMLVRARFAKSKIILVEEQTNSVYQEVYRVSSTLLLLSTFFLLL